MLVSLTVNNVYEYTRAGSYRRKENGRVRIYLTAPLNTFTHVANTFLIQNSNATRSSCNAVPTICRCRCGCVPGFRPSHTYTHREPSRSTCCVLRIRQTRRHQIEPEPARYINSCVLISTNTYRLKWPARIRTQCRCGRCGHRRNSGPVFILVISWLRHAEEIRRARCDPFQTSVDWFATKYISSFVFLMRTFEL